MSQDGTPDADDNATIEVRPAATSARTGLAFASRPPVERYVLGESLGRGAMGEVILARDEVLGRDVALKWLRTDRTRAGGEERFVTEAMIQARLDHPAIVPVHDVGIWDTRPFFTMRAVRGQTLAELLRDADGSDGSTHQLLTILERVCLAVDYAHAGGVIHRDLKPSNIMVGEFGEVYVLDWGVARSTDAPATPMGEAATGEDAPDATVDGMVVGSPAYMAPEQLEGKVAGVGPRSDVYALGALAFEALTGERFHVLGRRREPGDTFDVEEELQRRKLTMPPELAAVLDQALMAEPDARLPSARALAEALQRYAAGDRDRRRRKALSAEGIARARRLLDAADQQSRTDAMQAIGRSLALDPDNASALELLVEMLSTAPREVPREVEDALEGTVHATMEAMAPAAMRSYAAVLPFIPVALWMGVRDAKAFATVVIGAAAAAAFVAIGRRLGGGRRRLIPSILVGTAFCGVTSVLFGPFVLTPLIALVAFLYFTMHFGRAWLWPFVGLASAAILVPAGLQWAGVLPRAYAFVDGNLVIEPHVLHYPPVPTILLLAGASIVVIAIGLASLARFRDALLDAERRAQLHAWQLGQLLPGR